MLGRPPRCRGNRHQSPERTRRALPLRNSHEPPLQDAPAARRAPSDRRRNARRRCSRDRDGCGSDPAARRCRPRHARRRLHPRRHTGRGGNRPGDGGRQPAPLPFFRRRSGRPSSPGGGRRARARGARLSRRADRRTGSGQRGRDSSAPPKRPLPGASSSRRPGPTPSAGRRCAARWAAPSASRWPTRANGATWRSEPAGPAARSSRRRREAAGRCTIST